MAKNIVILLDGTSNEISANRTNVLRLYGTLEKSDRQLVYYDPGVGTFGAENAWSRFRRKAIEVWGLATGWGLDHNVKEAYRFLVENYQKGASGGEEGGRDRIFIFGFSRGAYSARVLAGFIHAVGLLQPRNLNLLDYAYRAYKRIGENGEEDSFAEVRLYERILDPDRPPVRLLGLFDTVSSVIEHGRYGPRLRSHAFTRTNASVQSVRHAVAMEENRVMFRAQYWPEGGDYRGNPFNKSTVPQDVREVWFAGSHGDVGGGYGEAESALLKIPLHWMIEQAKGMDLHFRTQTVNEIVLGQNAEKKYVKLDPLVAIHDSMTWPWAVLECLPQIRRIGSGSSARNKIIIPFFAKRFVPEGARIHRSVVERDTAGMRPPNMPSAFVTED